MNPVKRRSVLESDSAIAALQPSSTPPLLFFSYSTHMIQRAAGNSPSLRQKRILIRRKRIGPVVTCQQVNRRHHSLVILEQGGRRRVTCEGEKNKKAKGGKRHPITSRTNPNLGGCLLDVCSGDHRLAVRAPARIGLGALGDMI